MAGAPSGGSLGKSTKASGSLIKNVAKEPRLIQMETSTLDSSLMATDTAMVTTSGLRETSTKATSLTITDMDKAS